MPAALILASIPAASRLSSARISSCVPCGIKKSGRPMFSTGTGLRWAISTSFTPLPAPPIMAFSSTVTSASWLAAISRINASSSGFTKRISTSVAFSDSATFAASGISVPKLGSPVSRHDASQCLCQLAVFQRRQFHANRVATRVAYR